MTRQRAHVPSVAQARMGLAVLDVLLTPNQRQLNQERMETSRVLWGSEGAALAIGYGYDNLLIWLDMDHAPEIVVAITEEVLTDYRHSVQPLLRKHRLLSDVVMREYHDAKEEWALGVCDARRGKDFQASHRFERFVRRQPPLPAVGEMPSIKEAQTAHANIIEALTSFVGRHAPDAAKPSV